MRQRVYSSKETLRRSPNSAATEQHYITSEKFAERNASSVFLCLWEVPMTSKATEGACAFAWRNYLLLHSDISENDNRRSALYRYVANLRDTGEDELVILQLADIA